MDNQPLILAIGVDFARVEVGLVHTSGAGVAHCEIAPLKPVAGPGRQVYLEPAEIWGTVVQAVRATLDRKPREARRVAGVSLIGRSPSATFVSKNGALAPFVMPDDSRAQEFRRAAQLPWTGIYRTVGLTEARCEIPFALKAVSTSAPATVLMPKDFVRWNLTGEFATDALDAQRAFLWDLAARRWSDEMCGAFGVDARRLPPVLPAAAVAGKVTRAAAEATGLKAGLPVACGMGDWGEYLGSGVFAVGDAFEHIGTTGAFYGVTSARPAASSGLEVRPHLEDGRFLVGREKLAGGACLEWFLKKTYLSSAGEIDWKDVDEDLEAIAAMGRPENALFFPNLAGGDEQISDAAFMNLHIEDDLTSLLQAVIEGMFFTLKSVAEEVKRLPWTPSAVFTTGQVGFKHAPRRVRANIYGLAVHGGRTPGANAISAALVGAVAAGVFSCVDDARSAMLDVDGGALPDERARSLYEAHFVQWLGTRGFLGPRTSP